MRSARFATAVSCLVLAPLSDLAIAQTTGDIRGTVTDTAGAPLPGATVEIRSPALQGTRTAVAEVSGVFRFPFVPPGTYHLKAALPGFNPEERTDVRVGLGETTTVPITLMLAATAAVEVSGDVPLVDTASTRIGTSMPAAALTKIPLGRNYSSAMLTVGGTGTDTQGNTVYGATGLENNYVVEGLNTTGIFLGAQGKELNLEFVQEVEVRTGGYEAEYGKAMGASLNVITKSGGNEFHGDVFGYYDSGSLAASDQHAEEREALNLALPETPTRYDAGLALGGYVLKDTLWFFGAYDRVASDTDYQRVESLTYTPTSVVSNYVDGTDVTRRDIYSGKLTLRAGPSHTFVASVFGDPASFDGRKGANVRGPASAALARRAYGGTDIVARWDGMFGPRFLAQALYGHHGEENSWSSDYADQPQFRDYRRGVVSVAPGSGPGGLSEGNFRRDSWGATGTALLGSHELKAGMAYDFLNSSLTTYYSGGGRVDRSLSIATGAFQWATQWGFAKSPLNCQVRTDGSQGNFGFVDPTTCNGWEPAARQEANPRTRLLGVFLQDTWKVLPNLTVNAGLRYEDYRLYDARNWPRLDLTNQWSPRVGVLWDPLANGRSKVYASYGRYYQVIPQDIQAFAMAPEMGLIVWNYTPDHVDLVNDSSLEFAPYAYVAGSDYVPPGVKGIYQDEIIAGVEAEVWKNWSVGIKGIYRSLGRAIEDRCDVFDPRSGLAGSVPPEAATQCVLMNPGEGAYGQLSDPTNPDCWEDYPTSMVPKPCESVRAERSFRGIEVNVKRRFSDRFQLQASYLLSKLDGNYDGFVNERTGNAVPGLDSAFDTPDTLVNAYGKLSLDRTHQLKLSGFYVVPFGLQAGVVASFATGAPLSILGIGWSGYDMYLEPRGSWDRLPSTYQVDLHLEYPFRFGSVTVTPLVDVFNLTNVQSALQRGEVYNDSWDGNQDPPYTNPTVPSFGQNIAWQSPRIVRLGARVSF